MTEALKPEEVVRIIALWGDGLTGREIASRVGRGETTVYRTLARNGVSAQDRKDRRAGKILALPPAEAAEVGRRYALDEPLASIARDYDIHVQTVRNIAVRLGYEPREVGGRAKKVPAGRHPAVLRLFDRGMTREGLARHFDCSIGTIGNILRAYGRGRVRLKGGRAKLSGGYIGIYVEPGSPYASMRNNSGYVPEHRLVMAVSLGRALARSETVHHIDGDKAHNVIGNLQLRQGHHGNGVIYRCRSCGSYDVIAAGIAGPGPEGTEEVP